MELTYQIMLYGGIIGALITLPIAIWLFIKLDIRHVIEDLIGVRFSRKKRKLDNATFQIGDGKGHTSSSIRLKKLNHTSGSSKEMKVEPQQQQQHAHTQTELLEDADQETALLEETTLLNETALLNETELMDEEKDPFFEMDEDIVVVHQASEHKEGKR
ncbi:hypothetical protein [Gracilibacillus dipsosauri]|uniref:hypothetical protein n=1 Tax=Gracilibacillus dipsosauri TaxID=178340 RepID=UPI002408FC9B